MKIKILFSLLLIIAIISLSFKTNKQNKFHPLYSTGVAAVLGVGYTGAPFDNGGAQCSNCHGGGMFNPAVTLEMINGSNNVVTTYNPGEVYTIRLSIVAGAGSPKFGFQAMSVKSSDNTNLNNWGTTLPVGVKNTLTAGGRNYIEHGQRLLNGIIDIPWTAPVATTGEIAFYAVGNAVDGTGGTGGDNALSTSLTITNAPVPITLLSFTGKVENENVQLDWQTAQEINNDYFVVEHSANGINFSKITKIKSKGNTSIGHAYNYSPKNAVQGINYYRLKQVDVDGSFTYSDIVQIKNNTKTISIVANPVTNEIVLKNANIDGKSTYKIINTAGIVVAINILKSNTINVSKIANGNYLLVIANENNTITSSKFVKQ